MADTDAIRLDQSVTSPEQDRYGFRHVATQLAQSVQDIGREGSAVIGIEGPWGSGKTSLLNLLRAELDEQKEDSTFVMSISPWLDGSGTSLVESLLIPVAGSIAAEEKNRLSPEERKILDKKKTVTRTARTLMEYTRATARNLAPLAQTAAMIPGVPDASNALSALSETNWLKEKEKTTADLRAEISQKIIEMDLSFIILLDDLDRLEPAQAVEVVRLVKSVADFPRFRYILCYDKAVLAQAIKKGLGVEDGELYLQKIVQISFSLPRPESFVLRREFMSGAVALYESVNDFPPDERLLDNLKRVTDIYGEALKTPREVHLALNNLRFRYSGIRDYVYLPDLCFLQLIRITNPGLYDWVEEYLTERAMVESGDGSVSQEAQETLTGSLLNCIALYRTSEAKSATSLRHCVPGISGFKPEHLELFRPAGEEEKIAMTADRRLGSAAYWRYYFAFSSPQNVLPPDYFDELFRKAGIPAEQSALAEELLAQINSNGISSRTWFEHILSQLTWPQIASRAPESCAGLLRFFFEHGSEVEKRYVARNVWFAHEDLDMDSVVDHLLRRMYEHETGIKISHFAELIMEAEDWHWIACYFHHLLNRHGLVGNRVATDRMQLFSAEQLQIMRSQLAGRLGSAEITGQILEINDLTHYLWAWCDISGTGAVREWVQSATDQDDDAFLKLLLALRYKGLNTATGRFQALNVSQHAEYLGEPETIQNRLKRIEEEGLHNERLLLVNASIKRNRI